MVSIERTTSGANEKQIGKKGPNSKLQSVMKIVDDIEVNERLNELAADKDAVTNILRPSDILPISQPSVSPLGGGSFFVPWNVCEAENMPRKLPLQIREKAIHPRQ